MKKRRIQQHRKTIQKRYKIFEDAFSHQLDNFFDFLRKIRPLVILITLFIALFAIIANQIANQGITQNIEVAAYASLNFILFFLFCAYIFMALYWWFRDEYRDNFIIPGFLGVFGVIQAGISLWFYIYYSEEMFSPIIQGIIVYLPIAVFGLFSLINILKAINRVKNTL